MLHYCYFCTRDQRKKISSVLGFGTLTSSCTKGKRQDSIFGQLPAWNSSLHLISPHKDGKGNATVFTNWCWGPPRTWLGKHQTPELQKVNHHHPVLIFLHKSHDSFWTRLELGRETGKRLLEKLGRGFCWIFWLTFTEPHFRGENKWALPQRGGMSENKNMHRSFDLVVPFLKIHCWDNCTYKHITKYLEGCPL